MNQYRIDPAVAFSVKWNSTLQSSDADFAGKKSMDQPTSMSSSFKLTVSAFSGVGDVQHIFRKAKAQDIVRHVYFILRFVNFFNNSAYGFGPTESTTTIKETGKQI